MLLQNILKRVGNLKNLNKCKFSTQKCTDETKNFKKYNDIIKYSPYRREPMETNLSKTPIIMTAEEAVSQIKSSNLN